MHGAFVVKLLFDQNEAYKFTKLPSITIGTIKNEKNGAACLTPLAITIVILILWVALKAPKNDLLKAILSQIILRISVEHPHPAPTNWGLFPPPPKS